MGLKARLMAAAILDVLVCYKNVASDFFTYSNLSVNGFRFFFKIYNYYKQRKIRSFHHYLETYTYLKVPKFPSRYLLVVCVSVRIFDITLFTETLEKHECKRKIALSPL